MVTHVLRAAGLDPSYCVGGELDAESAVAGVGSGEFFVAEADESDGSLVVYEPFLTVLTGIEYDHMEHFADADELVNSFRQVVARTTGPVVYCAGDRRAPEVARTGPSTIPYGWGRGPGLRALELRPLSRGSSFLVVRDGLALGRLELPVPGRHNVLNALAATAAALLAGVPFRRIVSAFRTFRPVRRRFETVYDDGHIAVVSDYAHHPTEIRAALAAAVEHGRSPIVALFQPHRYTRTRALSASFPPAFEAAEKVVLAPVYPASEEPLPGGTGEDLLAEFVRQGRPDAELADSLHNALDRVWPRLRPGVMLMVIGAGDVEQVAHEVGRRLRERPG
jgi:UDP-N-acetylmuramate--alanine ligase